MTSSLEEIYRNSNSNKSIFKYLTETDIYTVKFVICDVNKLDLKISEVNLHKTLSHHNIIKYKSHHVSYFKNHAVIQIFMEFLAEGNLKEFIKDRDFYQNIKLFIDICHGLKYLHDKNISHLNIKSENILINKGIAKIGNFERAQYIMNTNDLRKHDIQSLGYILDQIAYTHKNQLYSINCFVSKMTNICVNERPNIDDVIEFIYTYTFKPIYSKILMSFQLINHSLRYLNDKKIIKSAEVLEKTKQFNDTLHNILYFKNIRNTLFK